MPSDQVRAAQERAPRHQGNRERNRPPAEIETGFMEITCRHNCRECDRNTHGNAKKQDHHAKRA